MARDPGASRNSSRHQRTLSLIEQARPPLAALTLFQKAAAAEQVDRALLDRIATELRRTAAPAR